MTTLEQLTHVNGIFANVRTIENCMVGISQTLARAGDELRKAQGDLYLWKRMAASLAKRIPKDNADNRKLIEMYESLKEKTK